MDAEARAPKDLNCVNLFEKKGVKLLSESHVYTAFDPEGKGVIAALMLERFTVNVAGKSAVGEAGDLFVQSLDGKSKIVKASEFRDTYVRHGVYRYSPPEDAQDGTDGANSKGKPNPEEKRRLEDIVRRLFLRH